MTSDLTTPEPLPGGSGTGGVAGMSGQMIFPAPPPSVPTVDEAWSDAMDELRAVAKTDYNQQQQFSFRGVDAVVNASGPVFRAHRVKVIPKKVKSITSTEYETRGRGDRPGTRMVNKEVVMVYQVRGPRGDHFTGEAAGEAADAGDKALSKAQSVAYRVFLLQALNLPTHERDPDADAHERASAAEPPKPPTRLARERLWGLCQRFGKSAKDAEAEFATQYGHDAKDADAHVIDAFAETLLDRWREEAALDAERERQEQAAKLAREKAEADDAAARAEASQADE